MVAAPSMDLVMDALIAVFLLFGRHFQCFRIGLGSIVVSVRHVIGVAFFQRDIVTAVRSRQGNILRPRRLDIVEAFVALRRFTPFEPTIR
jgi:hypothetical protein